jgi:hypothetical protein
LDSLTVLYINKEQTAKDQSLELTQAGIDAAFARSPRESNLRYRSQDPTDGMEYVLLNGKSTDSLGVVWLTKPDIGRVSVTNLARTLVDLTVRPQYGGGAQTVLKAFKKAREGGMVKSEQIAKVLREVEHSYPYHQAIGFVMDRAGFSKNDTKIFKTPGMKFDFYLNKRWKSHSMMSSGESTIHSIWSNPERDQPLPSGQRSPNGSYCKGMQSKYVVESLEPVRKAGLNKGHRTSGGSRRPIQVVDSWGHIGDKKMGKWGCRKDVN